MIVYISFIKDRHRDPEIEIFTESDTAVDYTMKRFKQIMNYPESIKQVSVSGYILNLIYELATGHAFVKEVELNGWEASE